MRRADLRAEDLLVLAAVVLLPWAFGGVELWAFRGAAALLAAAAAVAVVRDGADGLALAPWPRWLLPAFLLAALAAAQLVPLPPAALSLVSPRAAAIRAEATRPAETIAQERTPEARGIPAAGGEALTVPPTSPPRWAPVSLFPSATRERLAWYLALLLAFLTVRARTGDPARARFYAGVLGGLAAALAVEALLQAAGGGGRMLFVRDPGPGTRPFGPYVNPSHFAGAMELLVPWMAGRALGGLRAGGAARPAAVLAAVGAAVGAAAALAAASKAASAFLVTALAALALLAVPRGRPRLLAALGLLAAIAVGAGLLLTSDRLVLAERVRDWRAAAGGGPAFGERFTAWEAALSLAGAFPVLGIGFGAFREVFPRFLPAGGFELWRQAHNDYLEVAIEGGAVAVALVAWLAVGYAARARARWRACRGRERLERAGLLLGLGSLALHALVEFNHQVPANALLFVTAAAIALAPPARAAGERG